MWRLLVLLLVALIPVHSMADTIDATNAANAAFLGIQPALAGMANKMESVGLKLFYVLALLQIVITQYGQILGGADIDVMIAKFAKSLVWIAFCYWLMTKNIASNLISNTVQYFLNNAIQWAGGTSSGGFNVGDIINNGLRGLDNVTAGLAKARDIAMAAVDSSTWGLTTSLIKYTDNIANTIISGMITGIIILVIISVTAYMAIKVFMVKIEAMLVLAILPLTLAFLGLNSMREQGIAPFKSMVALIYRIIILAMVVGGIASVGDVMGQYVNNLPQDQDPNIFRIGLALVFGYAILGFIAFKSDQIASSLASGSANLGSGDAMSSAMAAMAGAAAGAAVASAATGAAGGAAKSMGEVIKGMGQGGSVSNASSNGSGKTPDAPPAKPANSSIGGSSAGKAPERGGQSADNSSSESSAAPSSSGQTEGQSSSSGSDNATSSPQPMGSGSGAGIDAPPSRNLEETLNKLADSMQGKPETNMDKLKKHSGNLANHTSQQSQATHVSITAHPNE